MSDSHALALRVSVAIATFMREEPLVETIQGLLGLDDRPSEIIVVDQTPEHDRATADFLKQMASDGRLRWIRLAEANMSRARNVGIRAACGDIVVFVDDDVRFPNSQYLRACVTSYEPQDVVGVGGPCPWQSDADLQPFPESFLVDGTGWHVKHLTRVEDVPELWGCNMSFRKDALQAIGGFDEFFAGGGYAELELCNRIRRSGRIVYEPGMKIHHMAAPEGGTRHLPPYRIARRMAHAAYYLLSYSQRPVNARVYLSLWRKARRDQFTYLNEIGRIQGYSVSCEALLIWGWLWGTAHRLRTIR